MSAFQELVRKWRAAAEEMRECEHTHIVKKRPHRAVQADAQAEVYEECAEELEKATDD